MTNQEEYERKQLWSVLWYYHSICLKGIRKTKKKDARIASP
jgi:hypothetical protein